MSTDRTVLHGIDQSVPSRSKLPNRGHWNHGIMVEATKDRVVYDGTEETYLPDGYISFIFDVSSDGGEIGSYTLGTIPAGTIIMDGVLDVVTTLTEDNESSSSSSESSSSSSQSSSSSSSQSESSQSSSSSSQSTSSSSSSVSESSSSSSSESSSSSSSLSSESSSSSSSSSISSESVSSSSSSSVGANMAISSVNDNDILAEVDPTSLTAGFYDIIPVGSAATMIKCAAATPVTFDLGTRLGAGKFQVFLRTLRGTVS